MHHFLFDILFQMADTLNIEQPNTLGKYTKSRLKKNNNLRPDAFDKRLKKTKDY